MKEGKAYIGDEIVEGSKLIAEFMGLQLSEMIIEEYGIDRFTGVDFTKERSGTIEDLEYHSSWDWLMPACKKFDTLKISERAKKRRSIYEDHCDMIDAAVSCYELIPVFEKLVEAITWYNNQNKQS